MRCLSGFWRRLVGRWYEAVTGQAPCIRRRVYNKQFMKKQHISLSMVVGAGILLSACAGNPPAWWNPSGIYDSAVVGNTTSQKREQTVVTPVKNEIPAEEDIAPAVEAYEEEKLVPLPTAQEEQTPGATAPEEKSPAVSSSNEDAEELSLTRPSLLD